MKQQESISFERLVDWIEERLEPEEAAIIAHAVEQGDNQIRETVAWLRAFQRASEVIVLLAPPSDVHQALLDTFTTLRKAETVESVRG